MAAGAVTLALVATGCGGDSGPSAPPGVSQSAFERQLAAAQKVTAADFAPADGKSLNELAAGARDDAQALVASSVFEPGRNRLAFGVLDHGQRFVYGKTAVYIAPTLDAPAKGPYPAPADALVTDPPYRSRQAAAEDSPLAAIYAAQVPFDRPGKLAVLVVTKRNGATSASRLGIEVVGASPIPAVGERPPPVETETLAGAGGDIAKIDTRTPAAPELHDASFKDVVGKRPVALLFATPQLCQSRVCGPVVDIELQLKQKYGDRMAFIHQEVYEDNQVEQGLRAPLREFKLQTEPWLFTINKKGRIAGRLEGSFGVNAFDGAVNAALR